MPRIRGKYPGPIRAAVPSIRAVLSGKKAATFFQLDRRISMMIDVQITSQIPLLQGQVSIPAQTEDQ